MASERRVEDSQKCASKGELTGIELQVKNPVRMATVGFTPHIVTTSPTVRTARLRA